MRNAMKTKAVICCNGDCNQGRTCPVRLAQVAAPTVKVKLPEGITAINVFVEIGGKQCIAIIDPQMAPMFVGMLGAYQSGQPDAARLSVLPDDVSEHLLAARQAIADRVGVSAIPGPRIIRHGGAA
jgi:hypothetical protein